MIYILELKARYVGELNGGFHFSRALKNYTFNDVQMFLMASPLYKNNVTMNSYCIDGDESKQDFQKSLIKFTEHCFIMTSVDDDLKNVLNFETSNYDKVEFIFRQYEEME
ncbi:MAG: hypothetical protein RSC93_02215 [Erysipelotrichaceae bacterium]